MLKVGKTTFLEALKRLEYLIRRNVPVDSTDYLQFLKRLDKNDTNPTSFYIEFEVKAFPDNFSGIYSYFIELDLNGILRGKIDFIDGNS